MVGHSHIDRWSWLMHQHIADRIAAGDESPLQHARENLERWRVRNGELNAPQQEWIEILKWPRARLLAMLRDEQSQEATRLRSNSPFAGVIDQQLRLDLLHEARAA